MKKLKEENLNFETDLKQAKAFVEKANPYYKRPKFDNITFFGSLLLSGYLSYKLVSPESIFGYVGVIIVFILSFSIADWLRKKNNQ